ncbi:Nucleic acid-binding, OB-fold-like protein [Niveomyces insectorum RCEF 264]|uniref:Nucleic acid-binding, OB-fold-like protein n=1 Tax=Niveomyces insectorum RCEF 264 TaxID=1081102 RepID=A0A167Z3G4_9HYPO|nr:Nucleic acid-binding, OB-fold-like protein [Niveomyces insectorum RCEF 264]
MAVGEEDAGSGDAAPAARLAAATVVPIAQLSPDLTAAAAPGADGGDKPSCAVRGEVTIVWPYNSVSQSLAFLLAESDVRLRRSKGQVRVQLHGPSAAAVAASGLGGGDAVLLGLDGVAWARDESAFGAPGSRVEWQLEYHRTIVLQATIGETQRRQDVYVDQQPDDDAPNGSLVSGKPVQPPSPPENDTERRSEPTPPPPSPPRSDRMRRPTSPPPLLHGEEYASPAFIKRARISFGSLFEPDYDIFEEDGGVRGRGRKRTRFGRPSNAWRYSSQSVSPSRKEEEKDEVRQPEEEEEQEEDERRKTPASKNDQVDRGTNTQEGLVTSKTDAVPPAADVAPTPTPAPRPQTTDNAAQTSDAAVEEKAPEPASVPASVPAQTLPQQLQQQQQKPSSPPVPLHPNDTPTPAPQHDSTENVSAHAAADPAASETRVANPFANAAGHPRRDNPFSSALFGSTASTADHAPFGMPSSSAAAGADAMGFMPDGALFDDQVRFTFGHSATDFARAPPPPSGSHAAEALGEQQHMFSELHTQYQYPEPELQPEHHEFAELPVIHHEAAYGHEMHAYDMPTASQHAPPSGEHDSHSASSNAQDQMLVWPIGSDSLAASHAEGHIAAAPEAATAANTVPEPVSSVQASRDEINEGVFEDDEERTDIPREVDAYGYNDRRYQNEAEEEMVGMVDEPPTPRSLEEIEAISDDEAEEAEPDAEGDVEAAEEVRDEEDELEEEEEEEEKESDEDVDNERENTNEAGDDYDTRNYADIDDDIEGNENAPAQDHAAILGEDDDGENEDDAEEEDEEADELENGEDEDDSARTASNLRYGVARRGYAGSDDEGEEEDDDGGNFDEQEQYDEDEEEDYDEDEDEDAEEGFEEDEDEDDGRLYQHQAFRRPQMYQPSQQQQQPKEAVVIDLLSDSDDDEAPPPPPPAKPQPKPPVKETPVPPPVLPVSVQQAAPRSPSLVPTEEATEEEGEEEEEEEKGEEQEDAAVFPALETDEISETGEAHGQNEPNDRDDVLRRAAKEGKGLEVVADARDEAVDAEKQPSQPQPQQEREPTTESEDALEKELEAELEAEPVAEVDVEPTHKVAEKETEAENEPEPAPESEAAAPPAGEDVHLEKAAPRVDEDVQEEPKIAEEALVVPTVATDAPVSQGEGKAEAEDAAAQSNDEDVVVMVAIPEDPRHEVSKPNQESETTPKPLSSPRQPSEPKPPTAELHENLESPPPSTVNEARSEEEPKLQAAAAAAAAPSVLFSPPRTRSSAARSFSEHRSDGSFAPPLASQATEVATVTDAGDEPGPLPTPIESQNEAARNKPLYQEIASSFEVDLDDQVQSQLLSEIAMSFDVEWATMEGTRAVVNRDRDHVMELDETEDRGETMRTSEDRMLVDNSSQAMFVSRETIANAHADEGDAMDVDGGTDVEMQSFVSEQPTVATEEMSDERQVTTGGRAGTVGTLLPSTEQNEGVEKTAQETAQEAPAEQAPTSATDEKTQRKLRIELSPGAHEHASTDATADNESKYASSLRPTSSRLLRKSTGSHPAEATATAAKRTETDTGAGRSSDKAAMPVPVSDSSILLARASTTRRLKKARRSTSAQPDTTLDEAEGTNDKDVAATPAAAKKTDALPQPPSAPRTRSAAAAAAALAAATAENGPESGDVSVALARSGTKRKAQARDEDKDKDKDKEPEHKPQKQQKLHQKQPRQQQRQATPPASSSLAGVEQALNRARASVPECVPLRTLRQHLGATLDVAVVAANASPTPQRTKTRQFAMAFTATDPSLFDDGHDKDDRLAGAYAASVVEVHLFRAHKDTLPEFGPGDGLLLRRFKVVALANKGFGLESTAESAYAVFRANDGEDGDEAAGAAVAPEHYPPSQSSPPPASASFSSQVQIKGPPVEDMDNEARYVGLLQQWYRLLDDTARARLAAANERFAAVDHAAAAAAMAAKEH